MLHNNDVDPEIRYQLLLQHRRVAEAEDSDLPGIHAFPLEIRRIQEENQVVVEDEDTRILRVASAQYTVSIRPLWTNQDFLWVVQQQKNGVAWWGSLFNRLPQAEPTFAKGPAPPTPEDPTMRPISGR